jgi:UDP-glucose 4-epimerase
MTRERVLVTGGAGAIGSQLVKKLCGDHEVLVLDDLSSGFVENVQDLPVRFWRGSVVDEEILAEVFEEHPTVVFHLAANFANQHSVDYPQKDLLVNGLGTLKILQHARDVEVSRLVYVSSSCVYGNCSEPLSEELREYSLDTPYAVTKLLGEQYVNFFHRHHAMRTVILRLFNSYGPGEYPGKYRNVIPNFLYRLMNGETLTITGTGNESRDFTFAGDVVRALLLAMTEPNAVGLTFNVASGVETTIRDLVATLFEVCGTDTKVDYVPQRGWDSVVRRCADISRVRDMLGFRPGVDLREGLRRTHRWFLEKRVDKTRWR